MKTIFDNVKGFIYDKNKDKKFGKSAILYAESKDINGIYPALYISKPKHIEQSDFELMIDRLQLSFRGIYEK